METCIFCKIIKGEIPCHKVYEDSKFLSFLDIHPTNHGHILVIPKKHYRWVWDMPEDYSKPCHILANALKKAFNTDYVVSYIMGEEVHHAHIHLVHRFPGDSHGALIDVKNTRQLSAEEMKNIAEKIREAIPT